MIQPTRLDLSGDRWVPFIRTLPVVNEDLTNAAFAMQVRVTPDAIGTPLVSLTTVTSASAEGVRLVSAVSSTVAEHIAADRLESVPSGYEESTVVLVSTLGIRINETTMETLPFPVERGDDVALAWDIHITPNGGNKDRYAWGTFTVRAGVTQ